MTSNQALRMERKRAVARMRRDRRMETLRGIIAILFFLAAFCLAGTLDYHDDSLELARWEEQGVTVYRW